MRYALSDSEWGTIQPILPDKSRGVPRPTFALVAVSSGVPGPSRCHLGQGAGPWGPRARAVEYQRRARLRST